MGNETLEDPAFLRNLLDILHSQNAMILAQQSAILSLFEQLGKAHLINPDSATERMRKLTFDLPNFDDADEATLSLCLKILQITGKIPPTPPADQKVVPIGKRMKKT